MRPHIKQLHPAHPILKQVRAYKRLWKGICGGGNWNDLSRNAAELLARAAHQASQANSTKIAQ